MPNVAVAGAGMAGIRCADMLIRHSIGVTIFEARDRIGGRVHQMESAGRLMDMGPNWIHGTSGNPVSRIAQHTNTILEDPAEDSIVWDSDGSPKSEEESAEMMETIWSAVVKAFKYSDEHSESIDKHASLLDYVRETITKQEKDPKRIEDLLKLAHMWGPFVGDSFETQSLKFFFLEECLGGETMFVASTYKDILNEVNESAINHAILQFNNEVIHFDIS